MAVTASAHTPVMLDRSVALLRPRPGGVYVDATLGLGGHAEAVLAASAPDGLVIGLDRDPAALAAARGRLAADGGRLVAVPASFADLRRVVEGVGVDAVDGILYDLGVSSLQLDEADRGFSYRADAPLDMRMDPTGGPTAADVVNTYPQAELARVLREYGEERFAGRIARFVADARRRAPVRTTAELVELVKAAVPAAARRTGPHPARRTFQALRIEVNGELDALGRALPAAMDAVAVGGRIVVLSYHSLEDRLVKRALADGAADTTPPGLPVTLPGGRPQFRILSKGAERPAEEEVARNPRAASARLRAAERIRAAA